MKLKSVNSDYKKFFSIIVFSLMILSIGFAIADELDPGVVDGTTTPSTSGSTTTPSTTSTTGGDTIGTQINQLNIEVGNEFLDKPISESNKVLQWINAFLRLGETYKQVIIGFIVLLIVMAGLFDILTLTSFFQTQWVKITIAVGLGIVFALTGLGYKITNALITFAAGFGALGVFIEIIASILVFIAMSLGSAKLGLWAAKRYAVKQQIDAARSSGEASGAIAGLRRIQEEFRKKK